VSGEQPAGLRRRRFVPQLVGAVVIGVLHPQIDLLWRCRAGFGQSEACVWGRAYMTLSRALGLIVVTPIAFLVLVLVALAWRRVRRV
jgi:hypothetical protein